MNGKSQPRASKFVTLVGALTVCAGCRDLDRFDTKPGEAYCGSMVAAKFLYDGFIPDNSRPNLGLRLQLDVGALTTQPGTLTTDDAATGICNPQALLQDAPLTSIREVENDALSLLEFGDGREYNFIAWVDSSCVGQLLAVVSLMKNDSVEVRLLKPRQPAGDAGTADDATHRSGFVVFTLAKKKTGCGF